MTAYRYELWRETGVLGGVGEGLFVMLNPSTADERQDDPTIRRCMGFARRERWAAFSVVNLFALRATDPHDLLAADDRIGPENNAVLADAFTRHREPVAAWGALHERLRYRARHVAHVYRAASWRCLGTTKSGDPRHPLFVRGDAPLVPWGASAYVDAYTRGEIPK